MNTHKQRIQHFSGTAYDVGYASGLTLGPELEQNISQYLSARPHELSLRQWDQLREGALPWLNQLPQRFQDEYAGLAEGAGLTLQRIAEWGFFETYLVSGCSGFVGYHNGHAWIGRNNDMFVPNMWGYALIREIAGRIPTMSLSLEGDIFSPSGLNQEQLWIHHQYLPVHDQPRATQPHFPSYIFLTEALETCATIRDVEALLQQVDRDDGMLLVVVDGKTEKAVIFECSCQHAVKRAPVDHRLVCTNHAIHLTTSPPQATSLQRYHRLEEVMWHQERIDLVVPSDLIHILADDLIEQREPDFGTVYSVVVCPGLQSVWYTFGGYPAASCGNWQAIDWPWNSAKI